MLFITIRSAGPETVPKVLEVAHQTRRLWHKAGSLSTPTRFALSLLRKVSILHRSVGGLAPIRRPR
jgi:hypothetical protein